MSEQDLVLYTNPDSRGRIVRWLLEELGEPYSTKIIEYGDEIKSAEYLAINPMGKVPALRHGSQIVTETAAICAYLADVFPQSGLKPSSEHLGAYYRWLLFLAGPVESAINDRVIGAEVPEQFEEGVGYGNYEQVINVLEDHLKNREYVAGPSFSAADVYTGSHVLFSIRIGMLERRPAFVEYVRRVTSRDAYKRVGEIDGPVELD